MKIRKSPYNPSYKPRWFRNAIEFDYSDTQWWKQRISTAAVNKHLWPFVIAYTKVLGFREYDYDVVTRVFQWLVSDLSYLPSQFRYLAAKIHSEKCRLDCGSYLKAKRYQVFFISIGHHWETVSLEDARLLVSREISRRREEVKALSAVYYPVAPGLSGRPSTHWSLIYQSVQFVFLENSEKSFPAAEIPKSWLQNRLDERVPPSFSCRVVQMKEIGPLEYRVYLAHSLLMAEVVAILREIPGVLRVETVPWEYGDVDLFQYT